MKTINDIRDYLDKLFDQALDALSFEEDSEVENEIEWFLEDLRSLQCVHDNLLIDTIKN